MPVRVACPLYCFKHLSFPACGVNAVPCWQNARREKCYEYRRLSPYHQQELVNGRLCCTQVFGIYAVLVKPTALLTIAMPDHQLLR